MQPAVMALPHRPLNMTRTSLGCGVCTEEDEGEAGRKREMRILTSMVGNTLNRRAKTHNFNPGFSQQQFNKLKERYSKP